MTEMIERAGLQVALPLAAFIERDVLPPIRVAPEAFWAGMADILAKFASENVRLLTERNRMQAAIDLLHGERNGTPIDQDVYQTFLRLIGYLVEEPDPFTILPTGLDEEVARTAGPQLVVPILNARFLLNAANGRWGSLYDALYGTDAVGGAPTPCGYDDARGARVIAWAKSFLDEAVPLADGSWAELAGEPVPADAKQLVARGQDRSSLLFRNNGLHIEVVFDRSHPVGCKDPAGIADVLLESALTTICDLEDSVAAVDVEDKVAAYTNWLGLMRGDLQASFQKDGCSVTRRLDPDRRYLTLQDEELILPGRSVLFVRNVGHLMTTPMIRHAGGQEAPEGIIDAIITSAISLHDLMNLGRYRNSRAGSIYIVKPKMHGPAEARFTNRLFDAVEDLLGLHRHVIKVGLMDEERRTSANLAACIHALRDRLMFINTGFLDRTGDEIHTSMRAGAMRPKTEMKTAKWLQAYEDRNVQVGIACGLGGTAQIGKGMWAAPDRMADMLAQKTLHPLAGASTAWVPSPIAATLHATHYHRVDVTARQRERAAEPITSLDCLLTIPLATDRSWTADEVGQEVDNNAQSILGYVVRWIDQGVGCSKVPDINDVGLMEDRATLRISSQTLANWILHGVCTAHEVDAAFARMAVRVDQQNKDDPAYRSLANNPQGFAMQAARALVFEGLAQPSGYTEPLLHHFRSLAKKDGNAKLC